MNWPFKLHPIYHLDNILLKASRVLALRAPSLSLAKSSTCTHAYPCIRFMQWHWDKANSSSSASSTRLSSPPLFFLPHVLPEKDVSGSEHVCRENSHAGHLSTGGNGASRTTQPQIRLRGPFRHQTARSAYDTGWWGTWSEFRGGWSVGITEERVRCHCTPTPAVTPRKHRYHIRKMQEADYWAWCHVWMTNWWSVRTSSRESVSEVIV